MHVTNVRIKSSGLYRGSSMNQLGTHRVFPEIKKSGLLLPCFKSHTGDYSSMNHRISCARWQMIMGRASGNECSKSRGLDRDRRLSMNQLGVSIVPATSWKSKKSGLLLLPCFKSHTGVRRFDESAVHVGTSWDARRVLKGEGFKLFLDSRPIPTVTSTPRESEMNHTILRQYKIEKLRY